MTRWSIGCDRACHSILAKLGSESFCIGRQSLGGNVLLLIGEIQVRHFLGGNAVQVHVLNLESGDDQSDSIGTKCNTLSERHATADLEDVGVEIGGHVHPVIDRFTRYNQGMSWTNRRDGHEDDTVIVLQGEVSGKFTGDDLREE